jgi:hypothetical protein
MAGTLDRASDLGLTAIAHRTGDPSASVRGWLTVGGRPADAVLAEAGAGWVPLVCRKLAREVSWELRTPLGLRAGVGGVVPVAPGAEALTIEAYDRVEGRRARCSVPLRRERGAMKQLVRRG